MSGPTVEPTELGSLESQARYIARPAMAMDALQKQADGLALETRPDFPTGATLLVLDPPEWIQRITSHIPTYSTLLWGL